MSAIAGVCYLDGKPLDHADLDRMVSTLAHRGSDGAGLWCEGAIGLGHRLLWTTPESLHEKLPLVDPIDGLVLTADARIDNREELIAAFGLTTRPRVEITDSELILAAYKRWGERCPEKLLGDFAFVLWDGQKQVLFCARDHFGVKPFYYHRSGQIFAFATEIKALFCLPEVPHRLNEVRVADYLVPMFGDKTSTFYEDILRLPPAHSMVVTQDRVRLWEYWTLDPAREVRLASDQEYAEAFRDIFGEAVRCRLRSNFPPGSLLSGGLDSSSITCVARDLLAEKDGRPLLTFSAIFDEVSECDERSFIESVLAQGGFEPHYLHADQLSPLTDLERMFWHEDEAFYAPNLFMHWGLFHAAREQGVRVLLDGFDGDTTVSHGTLYLTELARSGRWGALYREAKGLSRNFRSSPWGILWRLGLKSVIPGPLHRAWRALRGRAAPAWTANPTIKPDFGRRIDLVARFAALEEWRARPVATEKEHHYRGLAWGLMPFMLEVADRAAAAFSLEPRYPFFDRRLAEFCLALPPDQKISRGWTRVILRRAMAGILPREVQWRGGKSDLGGNFRRGLLTVDRDLVEEAILHEPQAIAPYVDLDALRQAYTRCQTHPTNADTMIIWKAASLALWLRHTGLAPYVREAGRDQG